MFAWILACSEADPSLDLTPGDTVTDTTITTDPSVGPTVTWYRDIQPLVQTYCQRCHQSGGVAPFPLDLPETVQGMAPAMLAAIDAGKMPPPASDPACHDYVGSDRLHLPPESRDILATWIEEGTPLGDPSTAVTAPPADDALAEVDLDVRMPDRYVPTFTDAENPDNEYRCFYIDPNNDTDVFVSGMHPVVDNPALVHHVVLFSVPFSDVPDDYDESVGVDCIDDAGGNIIGMMAAWAPGMLPVRFPEGAGIKIARGNWLMLQMHYYRSGADAPEAGDQSGYQFDLVEEVAEEVSMYPIGETGFTIPAGDAAYTDGFEFAIPDWLWFEGHAYGIFPHMHVLGTGYKVWMDEEGEENCLVESDGYDFHNQITYQFVEPVTVGASDVFHLECTWDNSAENPNQTHDPPVDVSYGERTDEEMCYAFTYLSLDW